MVHVMPSSKVRTNCSVIYSKKSHRQVNDSYMHAQAAVLYFSLVTKFLGVLPRM